MCVTPAERSLRLASFGRATALRIAASHLRRNARPVCLACHVAIVGSHARNVSVPPAHGCNRAHCCSPAAGPAIVHFQQTRQGFWEPLVIFIGVCEAYRVAVAWANPAEDGAFVLKDNYSPGQLGCVFTPIPSC